MAADFDDSTNASIDTGAWDLSVNNNGLTLSCWVWFNSFPSTKDIRLISKADGTGEQDHFWMIGHVRTGSGASNTPRTRIKVGETVTVLGDTSFTVQTWQHVCAIHTGTQVILYLDGEQVGLKNKSGDVIADGTVEVWLGANPVGNQNHDGYLAECAVWSVNLSVDEIVALANGAPTQTFRTGNLEAYWDLHAASGRDKSGNNHHGTVGSGVSIADHAPVAYWPLTWSPEFLVVSAAGGGPIVKDVSDSHSMSLTESSANLLLSDRPDTLSLSLSESVAILSLLSRTDSLDISTPLTSALAVLVSTSDNLSVSSPLNSANLLLSNRSDSLSISLVETAAILGLIAISDALSIAAALASGNLLLSDRPDTYTISLTETAAIQVVVSVSDTVTISIVDSSGNLLLSALVDNLDISTPLSSVNLSFLARSDSLDISISDSSNVSVTLAVSDSLSLSLTEASTILANLPVSDSIGVVLTESSANFLTSLVSDSIDISTPLTSQNLSFLGVTDTISVSLTESGSVEVLIGTSDTIQVGAVLSVSQLLGIVDILDSYNISISDVLSIFGTVSASDAYNISLGESGQINIAGENIIPYLRRYLNDLENLDTTTHSVMIPTTLVDNALVQYIRRYLNDIEFTLLAIVSDSLDINITENSTNLILLDRPDTLSASLTDSGLKDTNLVVAPNDPSDASWVGTNATITINVDGKADLIEDDSAVSRLFARQVIDVNLSANDLYTWQWKMKKEVSVNAFPMFAFVFGGGVDETRFEVNIDPVNGNHHVATLGTSGPLEAPESITVIDDGDNYWVITMVLKEIANDNDEIRFAVFPASYSNLTDEAGDFDPTLQEALTFKDCQIYSRDIT